MVYPESDSSVNSPKAQRKYNQLLFAIVAPAYQNITAWLSFGRDAVWKKDLLDMLGNHVPTTVLDLATGHAELARMMRKRAPHARIHGCDLSREMMSLSHAQCQKEQISLTQCDMHQLPFRNNSVTTIIGGYALRNAPDINTAIGEISRLLTPEGIGLFLDFSKSPNPLIAFCQLSGIWLWGNFWGLVVHKKPYIYGYLYTSLKRYPPRRRLHEIFQKKGCSVIHSQLRMFGLIELLLIKKGS